MSGAHGELLRRLLPPVAYDPNAPGIVAETDACGAQLDAFQAVVQDILTELDPSRTVQLLTQWETTYGLPGVQLTPAVTIPQRQVQLVERVSGDAGLPKPWFKEKLEAAGYTVVIDQPRGFMVGVGRMGDRLYAPGATVFYWRVRMRYNGALLTEAQKATVLAWLNSLKPGPSFVNIED